MLEFVQSDAGVGTAVSGLVTLTAIFISYWLQGSARLIVFSPNSSVFRLSAPKQGEQPLLINSGQVVLQNQGRQPAEEVEIVAGQGPPPAGYNIVPQVRHTTHIDSVGRWTVILPYIAPKEVVTIQILNGPPIDSIRSKNCATKYVPVTYQQIYPAWFNGLAAVLFFIGVFSTLYWRIHLVI